MAQLGLSNSTSRSKQRTPHVSGQENFEVGSHGFTGSNATLSIVDTAGSNALKVDTTSTNGYAYKEYTVVASTLYAWRVKLLTSETSSGNKTILWGTSAGDGTHHSEVQNVPGVTSIDAFTTGGSQTSVFLSLKVASNSKFGQWDDIVLETWDG